MLLTLLCCAAAALDPASPDPWADAPPAAPTTTPPPSAPTPTPTKPLLSLDNLHGDARLTAWFGASTFAPGFQAQPRGGVVIDVAPRLVFGDLDVRAEEVLALTAAADTSFEASDLLVTAGWGHAFAFDKNRVAPFARGGITLPISSTSRSVHSFGGFALQGGVGAGRDLGAVDVSARVGVDGALHPIADVCAADASGTCTRRGVAVVVDSSRCPTGAAVDGLLRYACGPSPHGAVGLVGAVDVSVPGPNVSAGLRLSATRAFLPPLANSTLSSEFASSQDATDLAAAALVVAWSPVEHLTLGAGVLDQGALFTVGSDGGSAPPLLFFGPLPTNEFFVSVTGSL